MSEWNHDVVCRMVESRHTARQGGWGAAVRELVLEPESVPRLVPDVWRLDRDDRQLMIWEVGDTHPVRGERLQKYVDLWWLLDFYGWDLQLVAVDRYGVETPVPLADFAYADLAVVK